MKLKNHLDLLNLVGYEHTSKPKKSGFVRTLMFGLITKNANPLHINPLYGFIYETPFETKVVQHGTQTLSASEVEIFKIFSFEENVNILVLGYQNISYKKPVYVDDVISYKYRLIEVTQKRSAVFCTWHIVGVNEKSEEVITATWQIFYSARCQKESYVRLKANCIEAIQNCFITAIIVFVIMYPAFQQPATEETVRLMGGP